MVYWCINYLIDGMKQAGNILKLDWNTKTYNNVKMNPGIIIHTAIHLAKSNMESEENIGLYTSSKSYCYLFFFGFFLFCFFLHN